MDYIPRHEYKETADRLRVGDSTYIPHQGCTSSNKLWVYNNLDGIGAYCCKCGMKGFTKKGIQHVSKLIHKERSVIESSDTVELPTDVEYTVNDFPTDARLWLYKSDIRNYQIEKYGICYSPSLHRVIIPVYNERGELITWQGRGLLADQTKYLNLVNNSKNKTFFKSWISKQKIHKHSYDRVVLVEDALSVIKVGRQCPTVAALGTSLSVTQANFLGKFKKVLVWMDNDRGGLTGSLKALHKVGLLTEVQRIRTEEDPKQIPCAEIEQLLRTH